MANLLLEAAADLAPSIINAFTPTTPQTSNVPPTNTDRTVLSTQSLPPPPPLPLQPSLRSSPQQHSSGLIIPFQHLWKSIYGFRNELGTIGIATSDFILNVTHYYRDAEIVDLEAVVYPSAESYKHPTTLDLVWTPHNLQPTSDNILGYPGSARITAGGLNLMQQGVVRCNLGYINPIVKCPIPYTNTPRLTILQQKHPEVTSEQHRLCAVIIRGSVRVNHPLATTSA